MAEKIHIGELISEVLQEKHIRVSEFAAMAHSDRTNMYRILKRESIDLSTLERYARILDYDFFRDLSEEFQSQREKTDFQ